MTDLQTGVMIGMLLAAKSGETPKPETHDGDYQEWLNLPEPNNNQAVFLVQTRVNNITLSLNTKQAGTFSIDEGYSIDWGDGSEIEICGSIVGTTSHTYTEAGKYIVTFTNICGENTYSIPTSNSNSRLIMAKYGDDVLIDKVGDTAYNLKSYKYLRYIRLSPNTEFNAGFFHSCNSLKHIIFDGTISTLYELMFYGCYVLDLSNLNFSGISEIPNGCFAYCRALNKFPITNCTSIGNNAFNACSALTEITLPNCTSIGNNAFGSCMNLKSATINNCTSIGDQAFYYCYNLSNLTISDECTFGTNCFQYCYCLYPHPDGTID